MKHRSPDQHSNVILAAEGGQSAEAANEKAADKAEKLTQRLSEREQAEGRMGGEAGQRIVYDEAAIERLLDRSVCLQSNFTNLCQVPLSSSVLIIYQAWEIVCQVKPYIGSCYCLHADTSRLLPLADL